MALYRDISNPQQSRSMQDVLQSLLLSELICPSSELWILSGWVTDIDVIDNRARAFSGICPDWPPANIRLSKILETLVILGAKVFVVMRNVDHNKEFHRKLKEIQSTTPKKLGIAIEETAHEKAIVGDDFIFVGSMNLTISGLTSNDEFMRLEVDQSMAAQRQLELRWRWEKVLKWE